MNCQPAGRTSTYLKHSKRVNSITECIMTGVQLAKYNYVMTSQSMVFVPFHWIIVRKHPSLR